MEDSKTIRARVQVVRERQLERFKGTKLTCNAEMGPTEVRHSARRMHRGEATEISGAAIARVGEDVPPGAEVGADDCGSGG